MKVPRCYKPTEFGTVTTIEIHHFADASSAAYGACSYIRLTNKEGKVHCNLLIGKCRLAPLKTLSIPKLELTAAVLAVRLDILLRKELKLDDCISTFWSDSTSVLLTIKNSTKRFPVFVANRISIIESHSNVTDWRHVPSELNPADLATRGCSAEALLSSDYWFMGPRFLWQSEKLWPQPPMGFNSTPDLPSEQSNTSFILSAVSISKKGCDVIDRLISRYSSLYSLKKAVAWLLRIKTYLLTLKRKLDQTKLNLSSFTVEELQVANLELIKYVQSQHFPSLIGQLSREYSTAKQLKLPRYLQKLSPVISDGILRVGGRLKNAPVAYDVKHPIILPSDTHYTELVIREHHKRVGHSGMGHLVLFKGALLDYPRWDHSATNFR